ncbi:DUF6471 domain-containing protein [Cupriavidus basilensis]
MNKPGRPLSLAGKLNSGMTESQVMEAWSLEACFMVKRAMKARGWGYQELAEALRALGIKRSATVINRRINRGNFSAGFLLACLEVLQAGETTGKP